MVSSRYNPEFAAFLEAERIRAGLGISAFAARLGISPTYYRQVREGHMPLTDKIRAMAVAYGADPEEWLRLAGTTDELGGIISERVSAPELDGNAPILGEIGEQGIIEFDPEGVTALEGVVRFTLRVATSSPGALMQAGDVVHFEACETAKRNDHVLIEEADGTHRLVRFVGFDSENRAVKVFPVDAPALPKSIRIEAKVIARLIGLQKF